MGFAWLAKQLQRASNPHPRLPPSSRTELRARHSASVKLHAERQRWRRCSGRERRLGDGGGRAAAHARSPAGARDQLGARVQTPRQSACGSTRRRLSASRPPQARAMHASVQSSAVPPPNACPPDLRSPLFFPHLRRIGAGAAAGTAGSCRGGQHLPLWLCERAERRGGAAGGRHWRAQARRAGGARTMLGAAPLHSKLTTVCAR